MGSRAKRLVSAGFLGALVACSAPPPVPRAEALAASADRLRPLHRKLGPPQPGDWLASHPEAGQTFREYLACNPVVPKGARRVIYVQPVGDFTEAQRRIVGATIVYLSVCFDREVRELPPLGLSVVPERARRRHPSWGMDQILSTYVLESVLKPNLPGDAAAAIALTAVDLWPGEGWNFVFGQASLRDRVGVWSLNRNGDPAAGPEEARLCLLRTIKTASHELGHMFSMHHCIAYECNMCGSNHREESDRRPLAECPECTAKIWWATDADPKARFEKLAGFCREHGLRAEQEFFDRSAKEVSP